MLYDTVQLIDQAELDHIEGRLQCRLNGRVRNLRLVLHDHGLVLCGCAPTYYAKQLAQHALMEITNLPLLANDIAVA